MTRYLLLILFVGLLADSMFGWGLGIAPGVSLKNALLYILVGIMAIELALTGGKVAVELPQMHLLFGLLFFVALLSWTANSFIASYQEYSALSGAIALKGRLLDHYLFFLVFFAGVRSKPDLIWLQRILLLIIAGANIVTVMDAYGMPDLNIMERSREGRVEGPLGEANQYGLFVAMLLPFLIAQIHGERGIVRAVLVIGTAATFLVLLLTVSRGAFAALVLGSSFSAVALRRYLDAQYVKRLLAGAVIAVIGGSIIVGPEYAELIADRVRQTTGGGNTYQITSGRLWIWSRALGLMMEQQWSLLTGYGWNTFVSTMGLGSHNVYLNRFFELGIIGFSIFVALLGTVLLHTRRALDEAKSGKLKRLTIGFFFGFAILMVGIFAVDLTNPWYFVWAFAGIAMRGGLLLRARSMADSMGPVLAEGERALEDRGGRTSVAGHGLRKSNP